MGAGVEESCALECSAQSLEGNIGSPGAGAAGSVSPSNLGFGNLTWVSLQPWEHYCSITPDTVERETCLFYNKALLHH